MQEPELARQPRMVMYPTVRVPAEEQHPGRVMHPTVPVRRPHMMTVRPLMQRLAAHVLEEVPGDVHTPGFAPDPSTDPLAGLIEAAAFPCLSFADAA